MPSLNRVQLMGYVGNPPEMRFTASGQPVTTFSVATSRKWKDNGGEWQEQTTWHNIVAWKSLAERCNGRLNKGSLVYIEGRLQTRSWEKDGAKHFRTDIIASQVLFLERNPRPEPPQAREYEEQEDELPF